VHRVIVILGVRRIDGDEGHLAPILAVFESRWLRGLRFGDQRAAEHMGDAVSVDRDQAERPFVLERAEPLDHRADR
jgi:hypothetical protein